ncbi:MAG: segregation/condensation protein A, partial [Lachnospiraceae bacterium]|nr:segregation/condensation protein A [Lachnospiraceae bacterium]
SKLNIIVSFLAVLELIKMGIISVSQDNLFDDIHICFKKDYNINYDDYDFTQY